MRVVYKPLIFYQQYIKRRNAVQRCSALFRVHSVFMFLNFFPLNIKIWNIVRSTGFYDHSVLELHKEGFLIRKNGNL